MQAVELGCTAAADPAPQSLGAASDELGGASTVDDTSWGGWAGTNGHLVWPIPGSNWTHDCSGTVVARGWKEKGGPGAAIITAAHCYQGLSGGTFTLPQAGGWHADVIDMKLNPAWQGLSDHPHDLAVVYLDEDVPGYVLAEPATVFFGDAVQLWHTPSSMAGPWWGYVAGFGSWGDCDLDDGTGGNGIDGHRRTGIVGAFPAPPDSCDDLCEGHCTDRYEWESDRTMGPPGALNCKGDSGGGLFAPVASGPPLLVGVDSGVYYTNMWCNVEGPNTVWAMTAGTVPENAAFLSAVLDSDADGVLDTVDNCPGAVCIHRKWDMSRCQNPDQADADGDGFGDTCDNCAPGLPGATLFTTYNPGQENFDGDDWGDACDTCPILKNATFPVDSNGDGVGDTCSHCAGYHPFPTCTKDTDCTGAHGLSGACTVQAAIGTRHCVELADDDDDDLYEPCDACPGVKSTTKNANTMAEDRERLLDPSLTKLPDACDPAPQVKLFAQQPIEVTLPGGVPLPQYLPTETAISAVTLLGVDLTAPTTKVDQMQGVLLRRCECLDKNGLPGALTECVGKGTYCDWAHPDDKNSLGHWQPMVTTQSLSSTPVPPDTTTSERFVTGTSYMVWRQWEWLQDLQSSTGCSSVTTCSTHSAIVAHVSNTNTAMFSVRDATHDLRDTFTIYDEPNWIRKGTPIYSAPASCVGQDCVKLVLRPQNMGDPGPDWLTFLRSPTLIEATATSVTALRADGDPADLTGWVSARFRSILGDGTSRIWLAPVEQGYRVRAHEEELGEQLSGLPTVGLPSALAWNTRPILVASGSSGLDAFMVGRSPTGEGEVGPSLGASSAESDPAATTGYDAVFSALDAAIYVVGGTTGGHASGGIAKFDLGTGSWSSAYPFPSKLAPSSSVLSTAYDQRRGHLYVLDVNQESVFHTARLVRYDLRTGDATKLLTWPYLHAFASVRIAVMDDGALALVAARATGYFAWRLDVSGPKAKFRGVAAGSGAVVDRPVMGDDDLVVPIWRQGRLAFDALTYRSFHPGAPCSTL